MFRGGSCHGQRVHRDEPAARLEHPKRLVEFLESPPLTLDVVDRKAGDEQVELGVREVRRHRVSLVLSLALSVLRFRKVASGLFPDWSTVLQKSNPKACAKDGSQGPGSLIHHQNHYRGLFLRHRVKKQNKEPVQLELFVPQEEGYEFKAIVTNKTGKAKPILLFHNGRASQENLFSELKSQCNLDHVPTRRLSGNQLFFLSAVFAHNLHRELQMATRETDRHTTPKRSALWIFEEAASIRHKIIQRAGRLTRPHGRLRLTLSGNEVTRKEMMHYLNSIAGAA